MRKGFQPFEPIKNAPATTWAAEVHKQAFTERKLVIVNTGLISQGGFGATLRRKTR